MFAIKGFDLDSSGDVVISKNKIQMIDGNKLLSQKCKLVLGTNKGEWFANTDEGINFKNVLGKGITEDMVRNEVQKGLMQVDSTFFVYDFSLEVDSSNRKAIARFKAVNSNGEETGGAVEWL